MTPRNDLRERTKEFGLGIIRMFGTLPKSAEAQVLGKQVLRSGTSIGANYREAYRGRSRPEFIAKCGDCLREIEEWSELGSRDMDGQTCDGSGRADGRSASQTAYRLELLVDSGIVSAAKLSSLRREVDELAAIFVTILKSSRDRS